MTTMTAEADQSIEVVRKLADAIKDAVEQQDGAALFEASTTIFAQVTDELRKTRGLKFPRQHDYQIHKSQVLEGYLFSFLKTQYIFRVSPNVHERSAEVAFTTMEELTNRVLNDSFKMSLPPALIWVIFAELLFVFRAANSRRLDQEGVDQPIPPHFHYDKVLNRLHKMIAESDIINTLLTAGPTGLTSVQLVGFFSQVALVQLHTVTANYTAAIREAQIFKPFTTGRESISSYAELAHQSLYYHLGYSLLMLRRYSNATSCFRACAQTGELSKNAIKLTVVSASLGGLNTDFLKENEMARDVLQEIRTGDKQAYVTAFIEGSPKFANFEPPTKDRDMPTFNQQINVFSRMLDQRLPTWQLRRYFNAFKTLSSDKAEMLLKADHEAVISLAVSTKMAECELVDSGNGECDLACPATTMLRLEAEAITAHRKEVHLQATIMAKLQEIRQVQ